MPTASSKRLIPATRVTTLAVLLMLPAACFASPSRARSDVEPAANLPDPSASTELPFPVPPRATECLDVPQRLNASMSRPHEPHEPHEPTDRATLLAAARDCAEHGPTRGLGIHGTPLRFSQASITTPAAARAAGETSGFAALSGVHRLIFVPESPPFDLLIPNGLVMHLNSETHACRLLRVR